VKGTSLQSSFSFSSQDRLLKQLGVSPHTVAAYVMHSVCCSGSHRNAFRRAPSGLRIEDLDAPFLAKFLDHLGRRPRQLHADTK